MAQRVVCVVGPTASGKTKMGVALAKRFNGEVVSVDSMQIYRGMEIGTAAPTPEEMAGVPHHMIGVADPAESWSVSRFTQEADRCIQDILRPGEAAVLVGGTGLYLDALVRGQTFAAGQQGGAVRLALQQPAGPGGRCGAAGGAGGDRPGDGGTAAPAGRKAHSPGAGGLPGDG